MRFRDWFPIVFSVVALILVIYAQILTQQNWEYVRKSQQFVDCVNRHEKVCIDPDTGENR